MKRLFLTIAVLLLTPLTALDGATPPKPNILFIFSDDHAQHAISAYGSQVNTTPNIDRLAAGGRAVHEFVRDQFHLHAQSSHAAHRSILASERRAGFQ